MNKQLVDNTPANYDLNTANIPIPEFMTVDNGIFETLSDADLEVAELSNALQEDSATFIDESGSIHIDGEANTENMVQVSGHVFGAPEKEQDEVQRLADAMYNDSGEGYWVDKFGIIHLGAEPASTENMTRVDGNVFGAPEKEQDEVQRLADAMYNDSGEGYWVDEFGRIRLGTEPVSTENMTRVDGNVFGAHEDQWYKKTLSFIRLRLTT